MIDREAEFRKSFYFIKRVAKSPLMPSYTWGYSRGSADKRPAGKVYNFILEIDNDKSHDNEVRVNMIETFLHECNAAEKENPYMSTAFYSTLLSYIKRSKN